MRANAVVTAVSALALAAGCQRQAAAESPAVLEGAVLEQKLAGSLALPVIERWLDAEGERAIAKLSDELRRASSDLGLWGAELRTMVLDTLPSLQLGSSDVLSIAETYRAQFERAAQDPRVSTVLERLSDACAELGGIESPDTADSLLSRMLEFASLTRDPEDGCEEQLLRETVRAWTRYPEYFVNAEMSDDISAHGRDLATVTHDLQRDVKALQRAIGEQDTESCERICMRLRRVALEVDFSRRAEHLLSDAVALDRRRGDRLFVRDGTWVGRPSIQESLRVFLVGSAAERHALEEGYEVRQRYKQRQGEGLR